MVAASFSKMCKNGNISERDKQGHCLCPECKEFRAAYKAKWKRDNKEKVNANARKWRTNNPDKVRESSKKSCRKYYVANSETFKERARIWVKNNPDRSREIKKNSHYRNIDKIRETRRRWRSNNKGAINATAAKRRAALLKQTPKWADLDKIRMIYVEAARLTKETGVQHHVDHIIPLLGKNISGLHVHTNLQILTASENLKKSNKLLI